MTTNIQNSTWKEQTPSIYQEGEGPDSEAIRSEIKATRDRMSTRLDQIQERFQPENMKQQAQDLVQNALTDGVATVKEYVNEYVQQVNWHEVRDSVFDTARRNPIPTALVGVGVGWLLWNSTRSQSHSNGAASRSRFSEPYQHGLGWREETPQMESPGNAAKRYGQDRERFSNRSENYSSSEGANRKYQTKMNGVDTESTPGNIKKAVENVTTQVRDSANQAKNSLYEQTNQFADQVQETMDHVGDGVNQWRQETFSDVTTQAQRTLDENPLLFGAVALGVGVGLALLLPETRYENQLVGDLREQAAQKAQGLVEEVKERAKVVVEEVQPELEKTASNVVQKVKDAGKQAGDDVRHSLQNASEKIEQRTESTNVNREKEQEPVPANF